MRLLAIGLLTTVMALCQPPGNVSQQGRDCVQNFVGNNNTGSITCSGVDQKLAEQINQLIGASKRNTKTLKDISDSIEKLLRQVQAEMTGSITQSNSGGINVQQGTTGNNSPIINSPISIGDVRKHIQPGDAEALKAFFASATRKGRVQISADQLSGAHPLPDEFYDAMKGGGWDMAEQGVAHIMAFSSPGRIFQGAVVTVRGEPIGPEGISIGASDPLAFIARALDSLKVPRSLTRNPNAQEGVIAILFQGGFPSN